MKHPFAGFILPALILLLLYAPVFYADYLYLDEAHQLWHNQDSTNYSMFMVQGRCLTGLFMQACFGHIHTITQLKLIRIISLLSWLLFLWEYFRLGRIWQRKIGFHADLLVLGGCIIACSPSVAVYIGWGSCAQVGLAHLFALWSGHLYFTLVALSQPGIRANALQWMGIVLGAMASLFMYQTAMAAFFLPFVFYLVRQQAAASPGVILKEAGGYIALSVLYYLVFRVSMQLMAVHPAGRMALATDIGDKLGFFFSLPLAQAFSLNLLYDLHSVPSQAFPILLLLAWITGFWLTDRERPIRKGLFITGIICFCMLIYAPLLLARENFSSYRSMFMLNVTVSLLLAGLLLQLLQRAGKRWVVYGQRIFLLLLLFVGFRNFRLNYERPLEKEYLVLRRNFESAWKPGVTRICFLRPPEDLFHQPYNISSFRDEFGVPSTYRDWTPEPLLRQWILERTGDRKLADSVHIEQFEDRQVFRRAIIPAASGELDIDAESLFLAAIQEPVGGK